MSIRRREKDGGGKEHKFSKHDKEGSTTRSREVAPTQSSSVDKPGWASSEQRRSTEQGRERDQTRHRSTIDTDKHRGRDRDRDRDMSTIDADRHRGRGDRDRGKT